MTSKYAKIENNIVTNIIICNDSQIGSQDGYYVKVTNLTKNAEIKHTWDSENLKFIEPKKYASWSLNAEFDWESPEGPMPIDGHPIWNEESLTWEEQTPGELHTE